MQQVASCGSGGISGREWQKPAHRSPNGNSALPPRIFPNREDLAKIRPGYEAATRAEIATIVDKIPHHDLAIQWDCSTEVQDSYGAIPGFPLQGAIERNDGEVRNLSAGESLDRLKGKWVLGDFWATWCGPRIKEMPKITSFYESHAKLRDRFEIVAIHSADGGASFDAIRSDYENLVKRAWNGKPLPFPLVFDSTGNTQKRWGIEGYPTTLLVDPDGKVLWKSHAGKSETAYLAVKARLEP